MGHADRERYHRQIILPEIGKVGQTKLAAAKVLVVGAGGLGCAVLPYLAAAGVGHIGIMDGDTVSLSNLQRQILYTQDHVGSYKAIVAQQKLQQLNPLNTYTAYTENLTPANALSVMANYDMVVDGSDNFATRYLINDACVLLHKPFVFASIYQYEGQVAVFNYNGGPCYRCLFPQPDTQSANCSVVGVVATLPGIIGTIQANEAIKLITGAGAPLSGKLLVMDTLTMDVRTFTVNRVAENFEITQLGNYDAFCNIPADTITFDALQQLQAAAPVVLIDVRESEDHAIDNLGGINVPYSVFMQRIGSMDKDAITVLYCTGGARSNYLAKYLRSQGFKHALNLENGMDNKPLLQQTQ